MSIDTDDLAWAAGFFDGDGCFSHARGYPVAVIGVTDRLLLSRFLAVIGSGSIYGPLVRATPGVNRQRQWRYQLFGAGGVAELGISMWPWLGDARREQLTRVFDRWAAMRADRSLPRYRAASCDVSLRESMAWAAGFFDAEGCFSRSAAGMTARVANTDESLVRRFLAVVGVGTIYGPYPHRGGFGGSKDKWVYAASGLEAFQAVYAMLYFRLGKAKRDKAEKILTEYATAYRCGHARGPSKWSNQCPICVKPGPQPGILAQRRSLDRTKHLTRVHAPGQVCLPRFARAALSLDTGDAITFRVKDGRILGRAGQHEPMQGCIARICARGVVTIPVQIRRQTQLAPGAIVSVSIEGQQVVLTRFTPSAGDVPMA